MADTVPLAVRARMRLRQLLEAEAGDTIRMLELVVVGPINLGMGAGAEIGEGAGEGTIRDIEGERVN